MDCYQAIPPGEVESQFLVGIRNPDSEESLDLPLKGFIDFREADGTVHELKTASKTASKADVTGNLQLTGYAYACWQQKGIIPKLKLVQLVKTQTPKVVFHETNRSFADFTRFYHLTEQVLSGIQTGIFYPNPTFSKCNCEYEKQCREWNG